MPSTLSWIDYDQTARERTLRILSLFHERDSRDELGLGGIRDSFADQFFPGTSTIQTRLRYVLFIPWIYKRLEGKQVPPPEFAAQAEKIERSLTKPLMETDDQSGVFGKTAGQQLKRLPSSVYWYGLGSWGIRNLEITQDQYHQQIGLIYKERHENKRLYKEDREHGDDSDRVPPPETVTWHPRLPQAPKGFPEKVDFHLTREEADFLLERITRSHPDSLLAHLAMHCSLADVGAPWLHPEWASFRSDHKNLLEHAHLFSDTLHGAALLYNLQLAEIRNLHEKETEYRNLLAEWAKSLDIGAVRRWDLKDLWHLTIGHGHTITTATRRFIEAWMDIVIRRANVVSDDNSARHLIETREEILKGPRSRFINRRALEQWGGQSGTKRLVFRWPNAKVFLEDLYQGLKRSI
jgi:hypothetical protein